MAVYGRQRVTSAGRAAVLAATAGLPPIDLESVAAQAELQNRVDRAYLVPLKDFPALVTGLGPDLRVVESVGRRSFGYESVYFDTPDLLTYRAHLQRRRRRFKARTRTYLDSGLCMFEVKTVGPRGATVKAG